MKTIKTKCSDGHYIEVEVSDEIADALREEDNSAQRVYRKEMYHRCTITIEQADSMVRGSNNPIEEEHIRSDEADRLYKAIEQLTPAQRRRVLMFMDNLSLREIAKREGCDKHTVSRSFDLALKKLKALLEN